MYTYIYTHICKRYSRVVLSFSLPLSPGSCALLISSSSFGEEKEGEEERRQIDIRFFQRIYCLAYEWRSRASARLRLHGETLWRITKNSIKFIRKLGGNQSTRPEAGPGETIYRGKRKGKRTPGFPLLLRGVPRENALVCTLRG